MRGGQSGCFVVNQGQHLPGPSRANRGPEPGPVACGCDAVRKWVRWVRRRLDDCESPTNGIRVRPFPRRRNRRKTFRGNLERSPENLRPSRAIPRVERQRAWPRPVQLAGLILGAEPSRPGLILAGEGGCSCSLQGYSTRGSAGLILAGEGGIGLTQPGSSLAASPQSAAGRRHPGAFGPRPNILMAAAVAVHTARFANPTLERIRHTSLNEEEEYALGPCVGPGLTPTGVSGGWGAAFQGGGRLINI